MKSYCLTSVSKRLSVKMSNMSIEIEILEVEGRPNGKRYPKKALLHSRTSFTCFLSLSLRKTSSSIVSPSVCTRS